MRYLIYCDESDDKSTYYSNFYGGALILEEERQRIDSELEIAKGPFLALKYLFSVGCRVSCRSNAVLIGRLKARPSARHEFQTVTVPDLLARCVQLD